MTQIKQLAPQDEFVGFYLLRELAIKQTNGTPPKDYFDIVLGIPLDNYLRNIGMPAQPIKKLFSYGACEGTRDCSYLS